MPPSVTYDEREAAVDEQVQVEAQRLLETVFGSVDVDDPGSGSARSAGQRRRRKVERPGFVPGVDPDDDYDVNECYVRTTNHNDHRAKVTINVPQDLSGVLAMIVEHNDTPYTSVGDIFRDAVVHRAQHWMGKLADDQITGRVNLMKALGRLEHDELIDEAARQMVEKLRARMDRADRARDWDKLDELIAMAQTVRDQMDSDRAQELDVLVDRYTPRDD